MRLPVKFMIAAALAGSSPALAFQGYANPARMSLEERSTVRLINEVKECTQRKRVDYYARQDQNRIMIQQKVESGEIRAEDSPIALYEANRAVPDPETACLNEMGIDGISLGEKWRQLRAKYGAQVLGY